METVEYWKARAVAAQKRIVEMEKEAKQKDEKILRTVHATLEKNQKKSLRNYCIGPGNVNFSRKNTKWLYFFFRPFKIANCYERTSEFLVFVSFCVCILHKWKTMFIEFVRPNETTGYWYFRMQWMFLRKSDQFYGTSLLWLLFRLCFQGIFLHLLLRKFLLLLRKRWPVCERFTMSREHLFLILKVEHLREVALISPSRDSCVVNKRFSDSIVDLKTTRSCVISNQRKSIDPCRMTLTHFNLTTVDGLVQFAFSVKILLFMVKNLLNFLFLILGERIEYIHIPICVNQTLVLDPLSW